MPKTTKPSTYADDAPLTDKELKTARPFRKASPAMQKAIKQALRGRPSGTAKKEAVHISLDKELVAQLRASGAGWQTRVNDTLRLIYGPSKDGRA